MNAVPALAIKIIMVNSASVMVRKQVTKKHCLNVFSLVLQQYVLVVDSVGAEFVNVHHEQAAPKKHTVEISVNVTIMLVIIIMVNYVEVKTVVNVFVENVYAMRVTKTQIVDVLQQIRLALLFLVVCYVTVKEAVSVAIVNVMKTLYIEDLLVKSVRHVQENA